MPRWIACTMDRPELRSISCDAGSRSFIHRALEPTLSRSRGRPVTGARRVTCAQRIARAANVRSSQASFSPLTVLTLEPRLHFRRLNLIEEKPERRTERRIAVLVSPPTYAPRRHAPASCANPPCSRAAYVCATRRARAAPDTEQRDCAHLTPLASDIVAAIRRSIVRAWPRLQRRSGASDRGPEIRPSSQVRRAHPLPACGGSPRSAC